MVIEILFEFCNSINVKSVFYTAFRLGHYQQLYTDASGNIGYGAVYGKKCFFGRWPETWLQYNITTLESYPIVAAVVIWVHEWANTSVCLYTDNEAMVAITNKETSREPCVLLVCLRSNILFTARRVPGQDNILAVKLSLLQMDEFRMLAP